jgi:hypothetical protein
MSVVSALKQFWASLQHRQVFRTAALYAVAAWGIEVTGPERPNAEDGACGSPSRFSGFS